MRKIIRTKTPSFLTLLLLVLSIGQANGDNFNRYARTETGSIFFVLDLECEKYLCQDDSGWLTSSVYFYDGSDLKTKEVGQKYSLTKSAYRFDYGNGVESIVKFTTKEIIDIKYSSADVQLLYKNSIISSFSSDSNVFTSKVNPQCSSRHGDAGFVEGYIGVEYPYSDRSQLYSIAERYGWLAGRYIGEEYVEGNELFFSDKVCSEGVCKLSLEVGPANSFFAVSKFNALGSSVCATLFPAAAGAPPLTVAGIPLNTFLDLEDFEKHSPMNNLKIKVIDKLFSDGVQIGNTYQSNRGKSFTVSVLGPSSDMGIDFKGGYWFKATLLFEIGINVQASNLNEELRIQILDMSEIRAPEHLSALPSQLIQSGRALTYHNPDDLAGEGNYSEDGQLMDNWTKYLSGEVTTLVGGEIVGDWN